MTTASRDATPRVAENSFGRGISEATRYWLENPANADQGTETLVLRYNDTVLNGAPQCPHSSKLPAQSSGCSFVRAYATVLPPSDSQRRKVKVPVGGGGHVQLEDVHPVDNRLRMGSSLCISGF